MTELEAVNKLRRAIGNSPISTLSGTLDADSTLALSTLRATSSEVQASSRWRFNTVKDYKLNRDEDNKFPLPSNLVAFDINRGIYYDIDVVIRNGFLYDRLNGGSETFENYESIEGTATFNHDWSDIPEHAQQYITALAAVYFVGDVEGDTSYVENAKIKLNEAFKVFRQIETDNSQASFLDLNHYHARRRLLY